MQGCGSTKIAATWSEEYDSHLQSFIRALQGHRHDEQGLHKMHTQLPCAELVPCCHSSSLLQLSHSMAYIISLHAC